MEVRFWGVRGSVAVSGAQFAATGGNTTCVEVTSQGHRLIFDGGTGLRALGAHLLAEAAGAPVQATLLFTHLHWDHIQGVPFFGPAMGPQNALRLLGPRRPTGSLRAALALQMRPPQFPIGLERLAGVRSIEDFDPGDGTGPGPSFEVGPFRITPLDACHPDGVVVYRVEAEGRAVVFATDTELSATDRGSQARALRGLVAGADLWIQDAQYTRAEYAGEGTGMGRRGWGHTPWEDAVALAADAGVARLALFHHDPNRTDEGVDHIEAAAQARFAPAFAAREGAAVRL